LASSCSRSANTTLDFATSSPAVVLAAIAARTRRIRLTGAVTDLN
jgi:alkanesulfonate monooxygenase SsuD/methylene tetrahydromethanopterin reductase-like flavin-dependent oxidoreductase (luciferase family)